MALHGASTTTAGWAATSRVFHVAGGKLRASHIMSVFVATYLSSWRPRLWQKCRDGQTCRAVMVVCASTARYHHMHSHRVPWRHVRCGRGRSRHARWYHKQVVPPSSPVVVPLPVVPLPVVMLPAAPPLTLLAVVVSTLASLPPAAHRRNPSCRWPSCRRSTHHWLSAARPGNTVVAAKHELFARC